MLSQRRGRILILCTAGIIAATAGIALAEDRNTPASVRRAIEDLAASGSPYPRAREFLNRLEKFETDLRARSGEADLRGVAQTKEFQDFCREALLANPLMQFEKLLVVRRRGNLGMPANWQGNCSMAQGGYDNEIDVLSPVAPGGKLTPLFRPAGGAFVGDVDLNCEADRMLFSMPSNGRWQVFEIRADGTGLRQVTKGQEPDVHNYDACYLPGGQIVYCSTAAFHGVPCVGGGDAVANLFACDPDGANARQLTFDQDHNWCPTVLNDGRLLYTRWEYSDLPHYFSRNLFHMNPDGTNQAEYYHSNSYWPNSTFYARPIPGHPTKVVAVLSGHHGSARVGELAVFDPALGRQEEQGAVQRIPGWGRKVKAVVADSLVDGSWPKYLHPYPLSDKYFLVSCHPAPQSAWGIYLVDVFDNMTLIAEAPGAALLEPIPFRPSPRPPVIPDRVDLQKNDAVVYLSDLYHGPGLKDVPPGTIKKLRIYSPHYAYNGMGGHIHIGIDGPWDARRILGTVPVREDGSAAFRVPANTPISVQPLDAQGRAVQLMRSWFTAMPGEVVSCTGCHGMQNAAPSVGRKLAALGPPSEITPWRGPARGFSFKRDVQPVLDRHCVGCHNETNGKVERNFSGVRPDFTAKGRNGWNNFTPSYIALQSYVRRPGPESDAHMQVPMEWGADTSELVRMLQKGHHNVQLDAEAWDRLYTWIDLNVPDHGTWTEQGGRRPAMKRRLEMRTRYADNAQDPEAVPVAYDKPNAFIAPPARKVQPAEEIRLPGWPFDAADAARRRKETRLPETIRVDLGGGQSMELALVPAGEFVMGEGRCADETPCRVKIDKPFYMGKTEVTNAQYRQFDPEHDTGVISFTNKDHSSRGWFINGGSLPVSRVNWTGAMAFCRWLAARSGRQVTLPTESQWEFACRAGTGGSFYFGDATADFSRFANLADASLAGMALRESPKWHPRDNRFTDGSMLATGVGRYQPNAMGLRDMTGNVSEWTLSLYRPYPYQAGDGRNDRDAAGPRAVRGGSWYDRPADARSAARWHYDPWRAVYNVGFRVIVVP